MKLTDFDIIYILQLVWIKHNLGNWTASISQKYAMLEVSAYSTATLVDFGFRLNLEFKLKF